MNVRRNIIFITIACMTLFVSCKKNTEQTTEAIEVEFGAMIGDSDSKTYLDGTKVLWASGDQISVNGTAISLAAGAGYKYGTFRGKVTPYNTNKYYIGYPVANTTYSSGTLSVSLPAIQTYNATQPLAGIMPMVSYIQGTGNKMTIYFNNVANILALNLYGNSGNASKVTNIEITSSSAPLTGSVVTIASDGTITPCAPTGTTGNTITLNCGVGVQLSTDAAHPTTFYVAIPKITTATTLTVIMYCANGCVQQNVINASASTFNTVNSIYPTAAKEVCATQIHESLGLFSVSANKQVYFSPGNLQWSDTGGGNTATSHITADGTAAGTWRFAEHQWDYVGDGTDGNVYYDNGGTSTKCNNANISSSYAGWIDLFGWGTSGYSSKYPYMTSTTNSDYPSTIENTNYDWGKYNAIQEGSTTHPAGTWRTLTDDEWWYLISRRNDNSAFSSTGGKCLSGVGTLTLADGITTVFGLFILPDNYYTENPSVTHTSQIGWEMTQADLEALGVVFLPKSGYRYGPFVYNADSYGYYWSTTPYDSDNSHDFGFGVNGITPPGTLLRCNGSAVRLVRDAINGGSSIDPFEGDNW